MTIAFTTVIGSHLYGLADEDSDVDTMVVYMDDRKATQKIDGDQDVISIGMKSFLKRVQSGSRQYLEAAFSHRKEWIDETYKPMIDNLVIPASAARRKYRSAMHKFCWGDYKFRRHAVRLYFDLSELTEKGRFNPTLSLGQMEVVSALAENLEDEDLWEILRK